MAIITLQSIHLKSFESLPCALGPLELSRGSSTGFPFSSWLSGGPCCCSCFPVPKLCPVLCNPIDCSTPGFPVHHYLPEFVQTHVCGVGDAIKSSHPLSPPSPALNLSRHRGLLQWVGSLYQVVKVLELQLQHQSFQWIFKLISFRIY